MFSHSIFPKGIEIDPLKKVETNEVKNTKTPGNNVVEGLK